MNEPKESFTITSPPNSREPLCCHCLDGRDAVLRATRKQLMKGAIQIKLVAGGGVSSAYDPLDVTEFLNEEIEAAALTAVDWGTYVCAHAYTPVVSSVA